MAGIKFPFDTLQALVDLNIGIAQRIDDNKSESFTLLYCNFKGINNEVITSSLEQFLRDSDAYVKEGEHYFFLFPFTDKYGAVTVRGMFEEFFDIAMMASEVSYPADGDTTEELIAELQMQLKITHKLDLPLLDP